MPFGVLFINDGVEAHRYIEKQAMDMRITRKAVTGDIKYL